MWLSVLLVLLAGVSRARTAQDDSVDRWVVGNGCDCVEQGSVALRNTLGQPVIGRYHSGNMSLCVGFRCQPVHIYEVFLPLVLKEPSS